MSLSPGQIATHYRLRSWTHAQNLDKLSLWRHSSPQSKEATRLLMDYDEIYCRAANKAGKTQWQYAVALALLQKRPTLDGVPLPQWKGPIEAVSLELDYPTQRLSSQKALLALIGDWPVKISRQAGDIVTSIKVKPYKGSDDIRHWSTLTFQSQKNLASGTGVRADLILGNEPPRQDIWEEIRKAAEAGRRILRIIGATPIKRSQWWWLFEQYKPEAPRDGLRKHRGWVEVRWSLEHNSALTRAEMDTLIWEYQKNPATYDARVYGDYCNTEGRCPFDEQTLLLMLKDPEWAREPKEVGKWRIPREDESGNAVTDTLVEVEVYDEPKTGRGYYLPLDGSSGIDDSLHDPAGFHVAEVGSGDLQARYVGPLPPYRLGVLGVEFARQYKNAVMDPEANKWSMGIVQAMGDCRYGNLAKERKKLGFGEYSDTPGFTTDERTRNASIAAIQAWIEAWRVGIKYARPCRKIIECLLDTVLDEKGRPVAGPGAHDEDMILWGMVLRTAVTRHNREIPETYQKPITEDERIVAMIQGKATTSTQWRDQVPQRPRRRSSGV